MHIYLILDALKRSACLAMEADDMIVVIVGEGENEEFPAAFKEEVLDDEEIEKLMETAATHGELMDVVVNEEQEESGDDIDEGDFDDDEDYKPEPDENDEEEYYDENDTDDGSENEAHNRHRYRMLRPAQQKSFVKELRDQYPELENDNTALITTLSEIMRNVKPPPPPQDYFIMNGIMFECVICGTISETQPAAGRHYQEKHGERYLICFACGVDFRSSTNLYKHEKRCMAPDAVVVLKARARVLGRKGRSRPYIPKHFPVQEQVKKPAERKFQCSQCPAAFVSRTYLRSHEMLHRGLRPYTCSLCPCAYTSLAALTKHRKKHSDVDYICDHCGRAFKIKSALVTHMNTHLPVKKFGCEYCERRYATKAAAQRHMQSKHLRMQPPYVCKICFKRYSLMSVLREHTKKVHGLLLMTRRMFFKSLPTLTDTQIEQAKVVLKSELEAEISLDQSADSPKPVLKTPDMLVDESHEQVAEESSQLMETFEMASVDQDTDPKEHSIVLSEEVLQYMQSIQGGFDDGENYNLVLIEDGEAVNLNYAEVPHDVLVNGQLVLQDGEYVLQSAT